MIKVKLGTLGWAGRAQRYEISVEGDVIELAVNDSLEDATLSMSKAEAKALAIALLGAANDT